MRHEFTLMRPPLNTCGIKYVAHKYAIYYTCIDSFTMRIYFSNNGVYGKTSASGHKSEAHILWCAAKAPR